MARNKAGSMEFLLKVFESDWACGKGFDFGRVLQRGIRN
jgi:hypothetical protein